jgi:hypothetical protein
MTIEYWKIYVSFSIFLTLSFVPKFESEFICCISYFVSRSFNDKVKDIVQLHVTYFVRMYLTYYLHSVNIALWTTFIKDTIPIELKSIKITIMVILLTFTLKSAGASLRAILKRSNRTLILSMLLFRHYAAYPIIDDSRYSYKDPLTFLFISLASAFL